MNRIGYIFCLAIFTVCAFAKESDDNWSKVENGVRAKINMRERTVLNGTRIIATYLTLQNVSDVANPLKMAWNNSRFSLKVVDGDGNELPRVRNISYDGMVPADFNLLILPFDCILTFNVSRNGLGIPKNKVALLDLGSDNCWIIGKADG